MITAATVLLTVAGALWVAAGLASLLATKPIGLRAAPLISSGGGAAALAGGIVVVLHGASAQTTIGAANLVGAVTLRLTPLAGVFVALLGAIALAIGLYAPRYHRPEPVTAAYLLVFNLAFIASLAVLVAGNAVVFLVAWETMTLLSYLLILRHHRRKGVARAAFLFLALGEVGFALIVAAFALLATKTGSLELAQIAARSHTVSGAWRGVIFVLALVGFGFKAGLVPLHIWLPEAHPVAPADGSAFLSGLVITLGVFGIALFGFELLPGGPAWWG